MVAARALEDHSNLTAVLYQQHNYDFDWVINESSRILSNAIGEEYDEGAHQKKCMFLINSNIKITNILYDPINNQDMTTLKKLRMTMTST